STTSTGSVTSDGTEAAWTQYNYPAIAMDLGAPLTDVPKYSRRKDDWLGRSGGSAPQTNFMNDEDVTTVNGLKVGTRTVIITNPDGTKNISVSKVNQSQWDDGLLLETRLVTIESSQERVWSKTKMFWQ